MKKKTRKTNAVRMLETNGIAYELRTYEVDEHDLSGGYVAREIGFPPSQVFKTLVVRGDKTGVFLACIPSDTELNIKELAMVSGNKRVEMIPVKELSALTGYVRGGVSPVGTRKEYPVYLDSSASQFQVISLSAGIRGCQMLINPKDLSTILTVHHHAITH